MDSEQRVALARELVRAEKAFRSAAEWRDAVLAQLNGEPAPARRVERTEAAAAVRDLVGKLNPPRPRVVLDAYRAGGGARSTFYRAWRELERSGAIRFNGRTWETT